MKAINPIVQSSLIKNQSLSKFGGADSGDPPGGGLCCQVIDYGLKSSSELCRNLWQHDAIRQYPHQPDDCHQAVRGAYAVARRAFSAATAAVPESRMSAPSGAAPPAISSEEFTVWSPWTRGPALAGYVRGPRGPYILHNKGNYGKSTDNDTKNVIRRSKCLKLILLGNVKIASNVNNARIETSLIKAIVIRKTIKFSESTGKLLTVDCTTLKKLNMEGAETQSVRVYKDASLRDN